MRKIHHSLFSLSPCASALSLVMHFYVYTSALHKAHSFFDQGQDLPGTGCPFNGHLWNAGVRRFRYHLSAHSAFSFPLKQAGSKPGLREGTKSLCVNPIHVVRNIFRARAVFRIRVRVVLFLFLFVFMLY